MKNTKFAIALLTAMLAVTTISFGHTAPDARRPDGDLGRLDEVYETIQSPAPPLV